MKKQWILAFDFDAVMVNVVPAMSEACAAISGRKVSPEDWKEYDHYKNLGLSDEHFLDALIRFRVLERAIIYSDAKNAIDRARSYGLGTAVVTSRGFHPKARIITEECLTQHDIQIDHLKVVGSKDSKREALLSLGSLAGYVDDLGAHLEDLKRNGFTAPLYLRDQPWNQHIQGFTRIHSLTEYVDATIEHLESQRPL